MVLEEWVVHMNMEIYASSACNCCRWRYMPKHSDGDVLKRHKLADGTEWCL
jgi:hypothetical protein